MEINKEKFSFNKEQVTEFIITSLAKYPYIIAFFICIILNSFFYCSVEYIPFTTTNCIVKTLVVSVLLIGFFKYKSKEVNLLKFFLFVIVGILSVFYISHLYHNSICKEIWLFIGFCLFLLTIYCCADKSKYKIQITSLLIIGISFSLCFCYILNTSIFQRQHDVVCFKNEKGQYMLDPSLFQRIPDALFIENEKGEAFLKGGHIAYIKYIQNNYHLPDGDVSKIWQFLHPPLHHIICAVWLEINKYVFSISEIPALENLQILSLFFVICIFISSYKILNFFKLTGIQLYCSLIIIIFSPAFILLSGSINNDALSVAFILGTIICSLNWKSNPTTRNILKIALCLGLGMMTKISTGLIIPALFVLFVSSFIKSSSKKSLIKQFILFLIVSIPLGTWFNIRNYVKYNIPFSSIHNLDDIPDCKLQHLSDKTFFERITDFSSGQCDTVFVRNRNFGFKENDYNPIIVLMKSALFSEFINDKTLKNSSLTNKVSIFFFIIFIFITFMSFLSMFYNIMLCIKNKIFIDEILFVFTFFVTLILGAIILSYKAPYVASMNFRYITPTVIIGQLFSGLFYQNSHFWQTKYRNIISSFLALSFAICSIIMFITLMVS